MGSFERAWSLVKEDSEPNEIDILPFEMNQYGKIPDDGSFPSFLEGKPVRSTKEVEQVKDVELKDGTILPTAYAVFIGISGSMEYFSPKGMGEVMNGTRNINDGDITHLIPNHICEGCGDELADKEEDEFEEGFVDGLCRDCRGVGEEEYDGI